MSTQSNLVTIPEFLKRSKHIQNTETSNDKLTEPISNEYYDDYQESHNSLSTGFHNRLKSHKIINTYHVPYDSSVTINYYKSKSECEKAKEHNVRKAYNSAEERFTPGSSKSIAKEAALFYTKKINSAVYDLLDDLKTVCLLSNKTILYDSLTHLIDNCYKHFITEFDKELEDSHEYYRMYNFDYFLDQVEIEKHDYRISEDLLFKSIETLFTDHIEYTINDLFSAVQEIEDDANDHSNTFFGAAFSIYKSYVEDIENLTEKIGKNLPIINADEPLDDYIQRCCSEIANK